MSVVVVLVVVVAVGVGLGVRTNVEVGGADSFGGMESWAVVSGGGASDATRIVVGATGTEFTASELTAWVDPPGSFPATEFVVSAPQPARRANRDKNHACPGALLHPNTGLVPSTRSFDSLFRLMSRVGDVGAATTGRKNKPGHLSSGHLVA